MTTTAFPPLFITAAARKSVANVSSPHFSPAYDIVLTSACCVVLENTEHALLQCPLIVLIHPTIDADTYSRRHERFNGHKEDL
jgi:hypothetical protein